MKNRILIRGLFVLAIALIFGLQAFRYSAGSLVELGPGMFPRIMSSILFLLGISIVVRSLYVTHAPFEFQARNIALVVGSLLGFALVSAFINMTLGILVMVFFASLASKPYSVTRNLKIAVALIAVAFVFKKLLGLNLPLY